MTTPFLTTTPGVPDPVVAQTQLIIDFLTSLGWITTAEVGYPLLPPPILDAPDRSVWITDTGGTGYVTEEAGLDAWTFQAMTRGVPEDPYGPQAAAQTLDRLILNAIFPVVVDNIIVSHAHRLSGPPASLPVDPADLRHTFTCNYVIITGQ